MTPTPTTLAQTAAAALAATIAAATTLPKACGLGLDGGKASGGGGGGGGVAIEMLDADEATLDSPTIPGMSGACGGERACVVLGEEPLLHVVEAVHSLLLGSGRDHVVLAALAPVWFAATDPLPACNPPLDLLSSQPRL